MQRIATCICSVQSMKQSAQFSLTQEEEYQFRLMKAWGEESFSHPIGAEILRSVCRCERLFAVVEILRPLLRRLVF